MGILSLFRRNREAAEEVKAAPSLPAPAQPTYGTVSFLFGSTIDTADGKLHVTVTPETAMRCAPVQRAVSVLSSAVSTMPLHLYKRGPDNSKDRASDHPLYKVLHRRANEFMSASHFREIMMCDALLHGNAFAIINRNDYFAELWHVPPTYVRVEYDELTYVPVYYIRHAKGAEETVYLASSIFHIRNTGASDYVGDSPVNECREAIALTMMLEKHGVLLFQNMARPSGIIAMIPDIPEASLKITKQAWNERTAGGNLYSTPLMPGVQDYKPISFSSVDAQFLETRKEQVVEIARVFGVPPHSLFEMGRATWDNITAERQEFLDGSLSDWLTSWEDEVYMKLLSPAEQDEYFAEFLTDNFLRMNPLERVEAQAKAIAAKGRTAKTDAKLARPGILTDRKADPGEIERKAFAKYLRYGEKHLSAEETKALSVTDPESGGHLVPPEMSSEILRDLVQYSPIRALADVRTTHKSSVLYPKRTSGTNAAWVDEMEARPESGLTFGQVEIPVHNIGTFVPVSKNLIGDSSGEVEAEVRLALAEDFGKKEATAFLTGQAPVRHSHRREPSDSWGWNDQRSDWADHPHHASGALLRPSRALPAAWRLAHELLGNLAASRHRRPR